MRLDVVYLGGVFGGGMGKVNDFREGGGIFNGINSVYV